MNSKSARRPLSAAIAALSLVTPLGGCAPLLLGGAVIGTGVVVTDRRTTGAQLEDKSIENKAEARVRDLATLGRINLTSYNRMVLITGEVPGETERAAVEKAVAAVENVRSVVNELAVGFNASLSTRSSDSVLAAKVKASLIDAKDMYANAFRVVAERGIVYLMGRVSELEATRATEIARSVAGVQKVVRVVEILTEQEIADMKGGAAPK